MEASICASDGQPAQFLQAVGASEVWIEEDKNILHYFSNNDFFASIL